MDINTQLLQQILDGTNQIIEVIDANTFELLFLNATARRQILNKGYARYNDRCFKTLFNKEQPCDFCPVAKKRAFMTSEDGNKQVSYTFNMGNRTCMSQFRPIQWNGRKAFVIYIQDITELQNSKKVYHEEIETLVNSLSHSLGLAHLDLDSNSVFNLKIYARMELRFKPQIAEELIHIFSSFIALKEEREQYRQLFSPSNLHTIFDLGQRSVSHEYAITKLDGTPGWTRITASLIKNPRTAHLECILCATDITAEKQAQQQARETNLLYSALANEYGTIFTINLRKGTIRVRKIGEEQNTYAMNLSAEMPFEVFWNNYIDTYVLPEYQATLRSISLAKLRERVNNGEKFFRVRFKSHANKAGEENFEAFVLPIHEDDKDHLVVASKCIDDILKKEEYEKEQLRLAREEAVHANHAKTNFLFNMSHDIRTPMNAIIGFTELMRKHADDPAMVNSYLDKMQSANDFLLSLINNVLEMARIDSGKEVLDEVPYNLIESQKTLTSIFEARLNAKHITLVQDIDIQHQDIIVDATKMREIMLNLLSNAEKYTPAGGAIHTYLRELPSDRLGYARYESVVEDNGIGMSEEFLKTVFDPFTREENSTKSKIQGTGLGMPIIKKLVELMGGTIQVTSELGKGSRFVITMEHRIAGPKKTIAEEKKETIDHQDFTDKRILLAEDNELNAEIAIELLEDEGFQVERAKDGVECIKMLEQAPSHHFDLILMDVQMPNMDGYKATLAIRRFADTTKAHIPIIAMTANAFDEDRKNALEAGMNDHIAKPLELNKMLKSIAACLAE